MYRHKFQEFGPVQRTVCIASSFYKEYIDDLIDDLIWSKFGIVQKKEKLLSIYEVYDWLLEEDSVHSIQYTNDVSICFLLIKVDAIQLAHKLAEFHNARSLRDSGRRAIYVSRDVIQADRDVRIHFPEFADQLDTTLLMKTREFAKDFIQRPIVEELVKLQLKSCLKQRPLDADLMLFGKK